MGLDGPQILRIPSNYPEIAVGQGSAIFPPVKVGSSDCDLLVKDSELVCNLRDPRSILPDRVRVVFDIQGIVLDVFH